MVPEGESDGEFADSSRARHGTFVLLQAGQNTCVHIYINICLHAYIYTCLHTYIHMQVENETLIVSHVSLSEGDVMLGSLDEHQTPLIVVPENC